MYCAITALDRYPLHSDKIQYIRMETPLYMHYCPLQAMLIITPVLVNPPIHLFASGQYLLLSELSHL